MRKSIKSARTSKTSTTLSHVSSKNWKNKWQLCSNMLSSRDNKQRLSINFAWVTWENSNRKYLRGSDFNHRWVWWSWIYQLLGLQRFRETISKCFRWEGMLVKEWNYNRVKNSILSNWAFEEVFGGNNNFTLFINAYDRMISQLFNNKLK